MFTQVTYKVFATTYSISKALADLRTYSILSYDCETQSIYSIAERKEAKQLVDKSVDEMTREDQQFCKLVANSSGLSHPSLVKVTHFIFGLSESESVILIASTPQLEQRIMEFVVSFPGKLIIHNSTFDLRLVHHRTGKFPIDYEDTQLLAKSYMNHSEVWKSKSGLKELMGGYYDPTWTLIETYDIVDYKNPAFLKYCAIDGAATFKLWNDLQVYKQELLNA